MIAKPKRKAVAYVRMSSIQQDKSTQDQLSEIREFAVREGYQIIRWKEYCDDGISGDDDCREGFQRLIRDAQTKRDFDVVLCWDQDRFSRFDPLEASHYWHLLRQADVRIVTVNQGELDFHSIQGILLASVNQFASHDFLSKLAKNVCRGQKLAAEAGRWVHGVPPFGYRVHREKGSPQDGHLTPDAETAPLVREMYESIIRKDISLRSIAADLNARGIKTARGKEWTFRAIAHILTSDVYLGTLISGKNPRGKHARVLARQITPVARQSRKKKDYSSFQSLADCIVVENAHPALVPAALWRQVQETVGGRRRVRSKSRGTSYPLSGLARCGHCGAGLGGRTHRLPSGKVNHTYTCQGRNRAARHLDECRYVLHAERVREIVLERIDQLLSDERIEQYREASIKWLSKRLGEQDCRGEKLEASLKKLDEKLQAAEARLLKTPEDMLDSLYKQIRAIREQRDQCHAELTAERRMGKVTAKAVVDEANALVKDLRRIARDVHSQDAATARRAISEVVGSIEIWTKPVTKRTKETGYAAKRQLSEVRVHLRHFDYVCNATDELSSVT